jgi:outer membrane protein OmpA-like peptidoglycan-associated protein
MRVRENPAHPGGVFAAVALLALTACSDRDSVMETDDTAFSAPSAPPPVVEPPPSYAEQARQKLTSLGAQESPRGLKLVLSSAQFEPGQVSFEPADSQRIDEVASLMLAQERIQVIIEGHTDNRGTEALNERLSRARARAVERALVDRGVNAGRIQTRAIGELQPAYGNDTAEGRQKNRRVELIFSDSDGRFAMAADQPLSG